MTEFKEGIKIVASTKDEFNEIQEALEILGSGNDYLDNFEKAYGKTDPKSLTRFIVLDFAEEIEYDKNEKRYNLTLPPVADIISMDVSMGYRDIVGGAREPIYNVSILCSAEDTEMIYEINYSNMRKNLFQVKKEVFCTEE